MRYIHENISQKITVDDLVKLVPLSRRLLETRFKKSMGTSIYDYIIQTRIEKMMQLLCEGLSVSEAAAELGFSDIKNVSRTFRQLKGITPSEYRKQVSRPFRSAQRSKFTHIGRFLRSIYYLRGKLTFKPNLCP